MQKYYCINATPRFALVQLKMNSSISKETNLKKCDLIKPGCRYRRTYVLAVLYFFISRIPKMTALVYFNKFADTVPPPNGMAIRGEYF